MPRFSEIEKDQIKTNLLVEGERLFEIYGLKKVTIDDIVFAVNIAKATFYTFYDSKESLYLDIVQNIQLNIFNELDQLLNTNGKLNNKQRVKQVFMTMHALMLKYSILSQIDNGTVELILRKVGKERLAMFLSQNVDATLVLVRHGIKFTCSAETASYTFQALYHGWLSLHSQDETLQEEVSDILLNGIIDKIVSD